MEKNTQDQKYHLVDNSSHGSSRSEVDEMCESGVSCDKSKSNPVNSLPHSGWVHTLLVWLCLFGAIMSGSAIGPMFKFMEQKHIAPSLAAAWRCQCMIVFLIPLAMVESLKSPAEWMAKKHDLPYTVYVHIIIASLAWGGNLLCWVYSLKFISTVTSSLIANTHPLMLVVYLHYSGSLVSRLEWIGVIVTMLGIVLSSSTSYFHKQADLESELSIRDELTGAVLCLLSAACEVVVLVNRQVTKKYVPLMQYSASTSVGVTLICIFASICTEGTKLIGICDKCVFGWVSTDWILTIMLFGLVIGVVCIAGFNYAVQYVSPLVFASILLVDPAVTGIISWVAGLEGQSSVLAYSIAISVNFQRAK